MTLSFGNMTVNLNIFNVIKGMRDEEDVCEVNMVDSVVQKYLDSVSYEDPLMSCLVSPSWDKEVTTSESEFLHSIIEHNEVLEANGRAPKFEPLPPIECRALPLEERPPKLELKPLPSHLKYAVAIESPENGKSFKVNGQRLKPFLEHFDCQESSEDLVDPLY